MRFKTSPLKASLLAAFWLTSGLTHAQVSPVVGSVKDLVSAETLAIEQDPMRLNYQTQQSRWLAEGTMKSQLPDPMLKFGFANLPMDNLAEGIGLDQDPMSQFSVGFSQPFTPGDSREQTRKAFTEKSRQSQSQQALRALEVRYAVRQLWYQLAYSLNADQLLKQQLDALKQNLSNDMSSFQLGNRQSQDLLQAELQQDRLREKLRANEQQIQQLRAQLSRWLGEHAWSLDPRATGEYDKVSSGKPAAVAGRDTQMSTHQLQVQLMDHPALQSAVHEIRFQEHQQAIAQSAYSPSYKLDLNYGLRNSELPNGDKRSDLLSVFVTMDLPLFTSQRQDQGYRAAVEQKASAQAIRDDLFRRMLSEGQSALTQQRLLAERIRLYDTRLIPLAKDQTLATKQAYQSNTAAFSRFIMSRVEELGLSLEREKLKRDLALINAQLNFLQGL